VLVPLDEDEVRDARARSSGGRRRGRFRFACSTRISTPSTSAGSRRSVLEEFPEAYLSVSHEVLPLYREFERFSTVA
jgi:5-oxoprolinase (ATP-hydrolysing)